MGNMKTRYSPIQNQTDTVVVNMNDLLRDDILTKKELNDLFELIIFNQEDLKKLKSDASTLSDRIEKLERLKFKNLQ